VIGDASTEEELGCIEKDTAEPKVVNGEGGGEDLPLVEVEVLDFDCVEHLHVVVAATHHPDALTPVVLTETEVHSFGAHRLEPPPTVLFHVLAVDNVGHLVGLRFTGLNIAAYTNYNILRSHLTRLLIRPARLH